MDLCPRYSPTINNDSGSVVDSILRVDLFRLRSRDQDMYNVTVGRRVIFMETFSDLPTVSIDRLLLGPLFICFHTFSEECAAAWLDSHRAKYARKWTFIRRRLSLSGNKNASPRFFFSGCTDYNNCMSSAESASFESVAVRWKENYTLFLNESVRFCESGVSRTTLTLLPMPHSE